MPDARPFVDRRLGLLVLFQDAANADLDMAESAAIEAVDDERSNVYATDVSTTSPPAQAKVILNTSSMGPDTLSRVASSVERAMNRDVGRVQRVEVQSIALSPGNKVRNAMGI